MSIRFIIICLLILMMEAVKGQTRVQVGVDVFSPATYGGYTSIEGLPNGEFVTVAQGQISSGDYYVLTKMNENGDTLWSKKYSNVSLYSRPSIISVSSGGFLLMGKHTSNGLILFRINDTGDILWTKIHRITTSIQVPTAIEVANGNFVIAGVTSAEPFLLKVDGTGAFQWQKRYRATGNTPASALLLDPRIGLSATTDGGYIIASNERGGGFGGYNGFVVKTDSVANVEWASLSGGNNDESYRRIIQTKDGGYVAVGYSRSFSSSSSVFDILVTKFDQNGTISWAKNYSSPTNYYAFSIHELGDGTMVIGGEKGLSSNPNGFFMKINANGNLLWANELSRVSGIKASIPSSDGGFVGVGNGKNANSDYNLIVMKVDSMGVFGCQNNPLSLTETTEILQNSTGYAITTSTSNIIVIDTTIQASDVILNLDYYCDSPIVSGNERIKTASFDLNIFPNPTNEWLNVNVQKNNTEAYELKVVNLQGLIMLSVPNINEAAYQLKCKDLPQGLYILICSQNGKIIERKKFLVQH